MVHANGDSTAVKGPESAIRGLLGDVGAGVDPLACVVGEGVTAPFWEDEIVVGGCEGGEGGEENDGLHFERGGLVSGIERGRQRSEVRYEEVWTAEELTEIGDERWRKENRKTR